MDKLTELNRLLGIESFKNFSEDESLEIFMKLVEYSFDLSTDKGTKRVIELSYQVEPDSLFPEKRFLYHYYLSIAWSDLRKLRKTQSESWNWDHPQVEQEIIHLRSAIKYFNQDKVQHPAVTFCQIHTNLANSFDFCGRFVAAMENWNKAIKIDGTFGMALGAKGNSMIYHGLNSLYDDGHRSIYFGLGYKYLKRAIQFPIEPNALNDYIEKVQYLETQYTWVTDYNPDLNISSESSTNEEELYRIWCLENVLFLNPLNDLGTFKIANHDPFALPNMVITSEKAGSYHSFFNQIKQEYITARLFLFRGSNDDSEHYADRGVLRYDMLDSSINSIQTEQIKTAFRIAYSLFDKISYFLNSYLDLDIKEHKVNFRTIWFDKKGNLREDFIKKRNLMFRALYWISKDLFYNDDQYESVLEPDASEIVKMRNYIEHKSFKVYKKAFQKETAPDMFLDKMSYSVSLEELYMKTLKVIKTAREAIMYLSLGIQWEEREKES
ncbi:LA2681 family HEPN domain-containing protein [Marivirga salinae]|uniref:LA2681 family HEPN domain-containing protein n=1 Tax=Marivirga salinarum TaxID=3059078 RepID=A0AA49JBW9_9BACT|nr:LA2681 family HEPN domain-containing protein [Marivirga sp. BDSF4-3]WKK77735.2 LA2681 family HEPN domain-containing protein [Marivirga sp. BDSF4-3]